MNKKMWLVGLMAAALMVPALTALAQDNPAPGGQPGGQQGGMNLERMKEKLGLSDDQVSKLKDLLKAQMEAGQTFRDQLKADIDVLQQKVDSKASDGDLKKALDTLVADRKAMEANRQKTEDMFREILTPLQQAKMVLGMQSIGARRMNQGAPGGGQSGN